MERMVESTLWEMLKLEVLTNDEEKKKEVETIKSIVRKEKNDC
ncbi:MULTISPECIES: hypothetical protein [Bacillus cereus group]|nr:MULTISPECIES: hypothetical protein [Bacillus cereus group]MDA1995017.1 hypothetical protein [Bacillus cereus]MDA2001137.1 hypothetical protein [Bacillus cereus]WPQ43585.1 hypothetical protein SH594_13365 [Bacillus cereus]